MVGRLQTSSALRRPLGLGLGLLLLLLLLLALSSLQHAAAFLVAPSRQALLLLPARTGGGGGGARRPTTTAARMTAAAEDNSGAVVDRRALVRNAGVGLLFLSGLALLRPNDEGRLVVGGVAPAAASVAFDPDRYGDKELKIATVNKLKQKLRNAIAADLSLAVPFLRIAINDGLGFDQATQDGGPDGSISYEMDRPQNEGLKPALDRLVKIKQEVQATNEITFADIVAFAGAVAIECVGGPRIPVQLGRTDSTAANQGNPGPGAGYGWSSLTGDGLVATLSKAGLGAREGVLLYGAVGAVHLAIKDAGKTAGEEDADVDEDGEDEPFIPTTFGRQQDIYGAQIGTRKFDASYLTKALKGEATGLPQLDKALTGETGLRNFSQKYAGNNGAFLKDLTECYLKLTTLGYTGTTRNS